LITKVDGSNAEEFKKRHGVSVFPTYLLFRAGQPKQAVATLKGEHARMDEVLDFVRTEQHPQLAELKQLASSFVSNNAKEQTMARAKTIVDSLENKSAREHAKYYITVMKKVQEKGADFVTSEQKRIQKLIDDKSTKTEKKADFSRKAAILNTFSKTDAL
jgi:hypothetical protein